MRRTRERGSVKEQERIWYKGRKETRRKKRRRIKKRFRVDDSSIAYWLVKSHYCTLWSNF